jgi:hypothetical protein
MENGDAKETPTAKALGMLSAFASVGARAFNLTLTDIDGEKVEGTYRPNAPLEQLRSTIARILQDAEKFRHNVIIRPRSNTAMLIQLDDLDFARSEHIAAQSVIVIRTSPANYQAWVAVEKDAPEDFARRLRKGIGADATASGSTRIAGSRNFKTKYGPDSKTARAIGYAYPMIEIVHANPSNVISGTVLERAGFVADREESRPALSADSRPKTSNGTGSRKKWPSYDYCVKHAPMCHGDERPDISRADFTWCRTAIEWGWSKEETAARLMQFSSKAKENGERYAILTATNAAASVDRQPYRGRSTPRPIGNTSGD